LQEKANSVLGSKLVESTVNVQSLPYQNPLRQDLSKQFIAAANQVQVLEAKLNGLKLASQTLSVQTNQLPIISRQYENLQRRSKLAIDQLSKFSQKREELMINAARQEVPWELIASPTVKQIGSSSLVNDMALGLGVGLLLGTGIALLLDKMNDVIYSAKDLPEELNVSILGMIPKQEAEMKALKSNSTPLRNEEVVSLVSEANEVRMKTHYQFSPFIESFRALNSQIRLLSPSAPIKSLVVSSSVPAEGKTTVAIHLAQAAAAMGQRVLLVNADLRKITPQDLTDQDDLIQGLTDVILGRCQLMDTVKLFPGKENLYVLPAGSTVLDSTSLLGSKKMRDLMKTCHENFDLVIYDTVPLNFADSLLLIPQTDGLLMVTSLGKVRREDLRKSLKTLEVSKVPVLGLVINMVNEFSSQKAKNRNIEIVPA
jgi:polysaccharide biosynthesis transport protein